LLVEVSQRPLASIRPGDTVARLGGESSLSCWTTNDLTDAIIAVKRVLEILKEPVKLPGREISVNASIGVALSSKDVQIRTWS
jgi:GGDEF domain-containing protein